MTTLLIIAHDPLASALKTVAEHAYPECASSLEALDVANGSDVEQIEAAARALLLRHAGTETLIFVDAFGASPCNAAMRLLDSPRSPGRAGRACSGWCQPGRDSGDGVAPAEPDPTNESQ